MICSLCLFKKFFTLKLHLCSLVPKLTSKIVWGYKIEVLEVAYQEYLPSIHVSPRRAGTHRPTSSYTSIKASQQLRSIHKPFVYGSSLPPPPPPKEGGAHRSVVNLKGSKSLCRILTCQDGRFINAQGFAKTERYFDQNRPPNGSNLDSSPEISPLHLAGQSLGVFMSFLWARKCPRVFTSGIQVEKDGDKTNHLHRWHPQKPRN